MNAAFRRPSAKMIGTCVIALALAACAQKAPPAAGVRTEAPAAASAAPSQDFMAMYDEARARSGIDEAYAALDDRLSDLCSADADPGECTVRRVVAAFGAEEGEAACRAEMVAGDFLSCIVNGKLLAQTAAKFDMAHVNRQDLWGNRDPAWQQLNKVMSDAVRAKCVSNTVEAQLQCRDDFALDAFEISRFDVRDCPRSMARDDCIVGVAIATLIRRGLPDL